MEPAPPDPADVLRSPRRGHRRHVLARPVLDDGRMPPRTVHQTRATHPTLTRGQLRATLLHRQGLLTRAPADASIPDVIDAMGGIQDQYAPAGYVALWSRISDFRRDALTRALEDRTVIQATTLRVTIHLHSAAAFWRVALGIRGPRRSWWLRLQRPPIAETDVAARAEWLRAALADGPQDVKAMGPQAAGFIGNHGLWVDLVRVPPSGTWERRRADRLGLAEQWVGPEDATEAEGRRHLVEAYLRAFGPAPWADIGTWAGVPATALRAAGADLPLSRLQDEQGRELVDLSGLPIADPDVPTPVRFLPTWEALLLVHARRTLVLPEEHRTRIFSSRNPFSVGTVLVGGQVAATWTARDGVVRVEPLRPLDLAERDALEEERSALEAFHR